MLGLVGKGRHQTLLQERGRLAAQVEELSRQQELATQERERLTAQVKELSRQQELATNEQMTLRMRLQEAQSRLAQSDDRMTFAAMLLDRLGGVEAGHSALAILEEVVAAQPFVASAQLQADKLGPIGQVQDQGPGAWTFGLGKGGALVIEAHDRSDTVQLLLAAGARLAAEVAEAARLRRVDDADPIVRLGGRESAAANADQIHRRDGSYSYLAIAIRNRSSFLERYGRVAFQALQHELVLELLARLAREARLFFVADASYLILAPPKKGAPERLRSVALEAAASVGDCELGQPIGGTDERPLERWLDELLERLER